MTSHKWIPSAPGGWQSAWVVWRWEQRANLRLLRAQLLSSLPGRLMLLGALLALHPLWRLLSRGVLTPLPLSPLAENGAVVLAHALAVAYCALATVSYYVVVLHHRSEHDPLQAHGGFAPLRLLYRAVVGVIGFAVPVAVVTLVVIYGDILFERAAGPARVAGFAAGGLLLLSAVAVLVLLAGIRAVPRRLIRGGLGVLRLLAVGMFVLVLSIAFVPVALAGRQPAILEAIGRAAERFSWGLQLPLLLALPAEGPALVPTALGLTAVLLVLWQGAAALRRWSEAGLSASAVDPQGARDHTSGLTGFRAVPGFRMYRLFWAKDIALLYRRSPGLYAQEQWLLLSSAGVLIVLLARILRNSLAPGVLLASVGFVVLMSVAALAAARGLGSLGREGRRTWQIRSVLSAGQLFRAKVGANALFVAVHAAVYGYLLTGLAGVLGLGAWRGAGISVTALFAAGAGSTFAILGTGVGFLFPDFDSRFAVLPGASRVGVMVHMSVAAGFSGLLAVTWASWVMGLTGTGAAAAMAGGALLLATALGLLLAFWAHVRLRRVDW